MLPQTEERAIPARVNGEEIEITYRATPRVGTVALSLGVRIAKIIGPGLATMLGVVETDEETNALTFAKDIGPIAGKAAELLVANLDDQTGITLVLDLLKGVQRVDPETMENQDVGKKKVFDEVYGAGNLAELWPVLSFVITVNGGFGLPAIGTLAGKLRGAASPPTRSESGAKSDSSLTTISNPNCRSGKS